ncbi:hypothetical protein [Embleya sp. MST-111070]|uniref:hypothetical protein n=1 Tax=Embleya sp. MST-111070 TaxID=3398231 RepID=UPI003F732FE0
MTLAPSAARPPQAATEPLLDHAVRTNPERLLADLSQPSNADLAVTVSNGGHVAVRCTSIVIELPVGTRPRDLAATGAGITATTTTPGWALTNEDTSPTRARFEFTPTAGEAVITTDPVSFKLTRIPVNSAVGVAYPRVVETSATGQNTPEPRERYVRLPKFPTGTTTSFPVGTNLRVYAGQEPIDGRPPAVRVPHGSRVTVAWNPLQGVTRHLHWTDHETGTPVPIDPNDPGHAQMVCGPLYRETTFTLQTVSQIGGQPVNRHDTFTLQVDAPEYPRVTLPNGTLGDVDSAGLRITAPVKTAKLLTVKEPMRGTNTAQIGPTLTAPTIKAATTRYSGTLAVAATFKANNLTAGTVTTKGLAATGRVNILNPTHTLLGASGQRTFTTDGLILANGHDHPDLELWVTTPTHTFKNNSWHGYGTFIAPVKAGQTVTWGGSGTGYTFHWYPFGL